MTTVLLACALARTLMLPPFDPSETWVLAVSCLQFKNRTLNGLPDTGRTDGRLVRAFIDRGVPQSHIVWVRDKRAETKRVDFEFRDMLARVKSGGVMFVYYTGHGYFQEGGLVFGTWNADVGGPGWRMKRAFDQIRKLFRGKAIVFAADCCASGRLVDYAAASKKPVAVLASGQAEGTVPEGWDFTTALAESVEGRPEVDLDHDGRVDWSEAVRHVEDRVKSATGTPGSVYIPSGFEIDWPAVH